MRFALWWLALIPLACGKSTSRSEATDPRGSGGSAASGAGGTAGSAGSAEDGGEGSSESGGGPAGGDSSMGGSSGGVISGSGGMGATSGAGATSGVGATSSGGSNAGAGAGGAGAGRAGAGGASAGGAGGGASGTAGNAGAGNGGAAGAPNLGCQGRYNQCGCGCCGGEPASTACYYPERGDALEAIIALDRLAAMNPNCATTGCAAGVEVVCCETAADTAATYRLLGYSQDVPYLGFARAGEDGRCSSFTIGRFREDRTGLPVELPSELWAIDTNETSDGRCDGMMGASRRTLLGAFGFVRQMPVGYCNYDVDMTLFFLADNGEVDRVRFKATGLSPQGYTPDDRCP